MRICMTSIYVMNSQSRMYGISHHQKQRHQPQISRNINIIYTSPTPLPFPLIYKFKTAIHLHISYQAVYVSFHLLFYSFIRHNFKEIKTVLNNLHVFGSISILNKSFGDQLR